MLPDKEWTVIRVDVRLIFFVTVLDEFYAERDVLFVV